MDVFRFLAFRFAGQPAKERSHGDSPSPFNCMKRGTKTSAKSGSKRQIPKRQMFLDWEVPASFSLQGRRSSCTFLTGVGYRNINIMNSRGSQEEKIPWKGREEREHGEKGLKRTV